jgi:hypothetical protein
MNKTYTGFSFLVIFFIIPVLLYGQTMQMRITSINTISGNMGYYLTETLEDTLMETDFFFEVNGFHQWYTYEMPWQSCSTTLPNPTYQVKSNTLSIGDSWTAWVGEPTTAVVTDTETVTVPAGTFFTYIVKHYLVSKPDSVTAMTYFSNNVGMVKGYVRNSNMVLTSYFIKGGSGFFPLCVGNIWSFSSPTGVNTPVDPSRPFMLNLNQNYPNPYNPNTKIQYSIAEKGIVTLKIYDILGKEIAVLVNSSKEAGSYELNFDASKLSSGTYIYVLRTGHNSVAKKMLLMK